MRERKIPVFLLVPGPGAYDPISERILQSAVDRYVAKASPLEDGRAPRTHFFILPRLSEVKRVAEALKKRDNEREEVALRQIAAALQGKIKMVA